MSWEQHTKFSGPMTKGLSGVHLRIAKSEGRNRRCNITIGLDVCKAMGWNMTGRSVPTVRLHLFVGTDDNAGKIRLVEHGKCDSPAEQAYVVRRKGGNHGSPQIETTPWDGLPPAATERAPCEYVIEGRTSLVVTLPDHWTMRDGTRWMELTPKPQPAPERLKAAIETNSIEVPVKPSEIAMNDPDFAEVDEEPEVVWSDGSEQEGWTPGDIEAAAEPPVGNGISKLQHDILEVIARKDAVTAKSVARRLKTPQSLVQDEITILLDQGLLKRMLGGTGGTLVVVEATLKALSAEETKPMKLQKLTNFERQVLAWICQGVGKTPIALANARAFPIAVMVTACRQLDEKGYIRLGDGQITAFFDKDSQPVGQEAAQ